jgi:hypothetical protein
MTGSRSEEAEISDESEFLELRQVNVARGERVVLHDVNLTIRTNAQRPPRGVAVAVLLEEQRLTARSSS